MGNETNLPPKFIFSSNFGHFILKMLDYAKQLCVSRKKLLKFHNFWEKSLADFSTAGNASPPVPPAFGAHGCRCVGVTKTSTSSV